MSNILITFFAYFIHKIFGEFNFSKHPIVLIKEMITFFEETFYKDSVLRGSLFVMLMLVSISIASISIYLYLSYLPMAINVVISSFIASMFITRKLPYDSTKNLNDGVVAPIFYLLFLGLPGIILYRTIGTMDSMLEHKNDRYEKYIKPTAILNDIVNYIPLKITAVIISKKLT